MYDTVDDGRQKISVLHMEYRIICRFICRFRIFIDPHVDLLLSSGPYLIDS